MSPNVVYPSAVAQVMNSEMTVSPMWRLNNEGKRTATGFWLIVATVITATVYTVWSADERLHWPYNNNNNKMAINMAP